MEITLFSVEITPFSVEITPFSVEITLFLWRKRLLVGEVFAVEVLELPSGGQQL